MKQRLNALVQYGTTALQQRERDSSQCAPTPRPYQIWMCPACDHIHSHDPIDLDPYACDECDWQGSRNQLLLGDKTCSKLDS